jgi:ribosomal protein S18 acetylase RimI-like enzyme
MVQYFSRKPTIEEYQLLQKSSGWDKKQVISPKRMKMSINSSPVCVVAKDKGKIVGMVRLSGDLAMYGYIQDTIVIPEFKGKGIGTQLMKRLLRKVEGLEGYLIGVCPSKVSVSLYSKFGLIERGVQKEGGPAPFRYLQVSGDNLKKILDSIK